MAFYASLSFAQVSTYFDQIKKDPNALYTFFKAMPKGGELHYHLAGGPYPETMLKLGATGDYCLNTTTLAVTKNTPPCEGVLLKDLANKPELYAAVVRRWSMKDFLPGKESGHDHFFNGFNLYMPLVFDYRPALLADVIARAAQQQEQYLEVMAIPDNAHSLDFGHVISNSISYDKKREALLANKAFQNNINHTIQESDRLLDRAHSQLGCQANPKIDACQVKVKLLYYVLREQPLDALFAQTLNAFEAVSRSKNALVGINLVQPEDGIIALRDYQKQMAVFDYFHKLYPQVHIALHAGELAPAAVVPEELGYHIHDAIFTGHAERIGHGVTIGFENQAENTLNHMATHHLPVEINLISNLHILNVSGSNHPLNDYLSHKVPVVLSSDDEGVLRTDLTRQYVEAVIHHHLNYPAIKLINRNALTYAFLPGKSLWSEPNLAIPVKDCQDLNSETCKKFIKGNEKAQMQRQLEQRLTVFEKKSGSFEKKVKVR